MLQTAWRPVTHTTCHIHITSFIQPTWMETRLFIYHSYYTYLFIEHNLVQQALRHLFFWVVSRDYSNYTDYDNIGLHKRKLINHFMTFKILLTFNLVRFSHLFKFNSGTQSYQRKQSKSNPKRCLQTGKWLHSGSRRPPHVSRARPPGSDRVDKRKISRTPAIPPLNLNPSRADNGDVYLFRFLQIHIYFCVPISFT